MWLQLFFWISSSVPLQWLSSKKLMECLKGQRFQFLGMFQWFCEKANFGCKGKFWLNFGQNLPFHRTLSKKPKFAFSLKAPHYNWKCIAETKGIRCGVMWEKDTNFVENTLALFWLQPKQGRIQGIIFCAEKVSKEN